jgi:hypothetical protein
VLDPVGVLSTRAPVAYMTTASDNQDQTWRKKRALELYNKGYSLRASATSCGLSKSSFHRYIKSCMEHTGNGPGVAAHSDPFPSIVNPLTMGQYHILDACNWQSATNQRHSK